jgi:phosphatidylglycerophosphatase A
MTIQKLFITFFGTGLSPKAPGTVGSLAALLAGMAILSLLGEETLFLATIAVSVIGIFEINKYEQIVGTHDNQEIVIDEVAGMWIAMLITFPMAVKFSFLYPYGAFVAFFISFLAFRLFDIWKPSTIGKIDKNVKGGLGVMGDDILAGIAGGILTLLILLGFEKIISII